MATKDRTSLKNDFANGKYATGEKFADLIDSMKVVQLPVVDPVALGTSLSFIDSITQDADGKITVTKKRMSPTVGSFQFVANDATAEAAFTAVGAKYSGAISGVSPSADTLGVILLMNDDDTTPTKTMMITTEEVTPATNPVTYQFVYVGDLSSALPSGVLTVADIVNGFTGGVDKVMSAEAGKALKESVLVRTYNLYDKDDPNCIEHYAFDGNGIPVQTSDDVKITGFIPVTEGETYTALPVISRGAVWYAADKTTIVYVQNFAADRTAPEGAAFVRLGVQISTDDTNMFVVSTNKNKPYLPYYITKIADNTIGQNNLLDGSVTRNKIQDGAVSVEKIDFITIPEGGNLYDKDDEGCVNSAMLSSTTGTPVVHSSYSTYKVSAFIPVKPNTAYCGGTGLGTGWFYDEDKNTISGSKFNTMGATVPITSPSTAKYLRVTLAIAYDGSKNFIKEGTSGSYSPFMQVLKNKYLNVDDITKGKVEVKIPSKIYCVVGETQQLFYKSMFKCVNPYIYDIKVVTNCTYKLAYNEPAIAAYPRYIEIKMPPEAAGNTYTLTVSVRNNDGVEIGTKTAELIVSSAGESPSSQTNILILGDSTPRNGVFPDELQRRLIGTGGTPAGSGFTNIALVGRQVGTNEGSTAHMECGGGNFYSYITTDIKSKNPFLYNGQVNDESIQKYVTDYCNGQVDLILTTLFANSTRPYAGNVSTIMDHFNTFITKFKSALPNVKFGIGLEFNYDIRGGLGFNYAPTGGDGDWSSWYSMAITHYAILDALEKWIEDHNAQDYVFVLNLLNEFDCENGYLQAMKKLNVRMPDNPEPGFVEVVKEPFGRNGVHPSDYGRKMFADTAWRLIVSKFCQPTE